MHPPLSPPIPLSALPFSFQLLCPPVFPLSPPSFFPVITDFATLQTCVVLNFKNAELQLDVFASVKNWKFFCFIFLLASLWICGVGHFECEPNT